MIERHLSRNVFVRTPLGEKQFYLSIVSIERDSDGKVKGWNIDRFEYEIANVVYHDRPIVIDVKSRGDVTLYEL